MSDPQPNQAAPKSQAIPAAAVDAAKNAPKSRAIPATALEAAKAARNSRAIPAAALEAAKCAQPLSEVELLVAIDQVPSLPTVVQQVLTATAKDNTSAADLDVIIRRDMAITGRLLKMVNSPFYAQAKEVTSISKAVNVLGFSGLKSLVLAASTAGMMEQEMDAYGFASKGLWRNSITTAALARDIAKRVGASDNEAEESFSSGLLRDVGMLVLAPFLTKRGIALRRDGTDRDIIAREQQALGFDHCWVGLRIMEAWRLPKSLLPAIERHHQLAAGVSPAALRQISLVRLAERIAFSVGMGVIADHPFDAKVDFDLIQACGLDSAGFRQLVAEAPRILHSAEDSLA